MDPPVTKKIIKVIIKGIINMHNEVIKFKTDFVLAAATKGNKTNNIKSGLKTTDKPIANI